MQKGEFHVQTEDEHFRSSSIRLEGPVVLDGDEVCHCLANSDRLVGLVVKASASRAGGPGFESR